MDGRTYAHAVSGSAEPVLGELMFPASFLNSLNAPMPNSFIRTAGRKNGKPAIFLSDEESETLALPFRFTLIGKFSAKQPKMDAIKRHFELLKLVGDWNIGYLDNRHIMVKLAKEEDYALIFSKRMFFIDGVHTKFLKWTLDFNYKNEPPIAPIWIRLLRLKLHYFHQEVLYSIASIFGKPLKTDIQTHKFTRPSAARILVEMDITTKHSSEIWLGSQTNGYWQQIIFDNIPYYCTRCSLFGHTLDRCFHVHPELKTNHTQHALVEDHQHLTALIPTVLPAISDFRTAAGAASNVQTSDVNAGAVLNPGTATIAKNTNLNTLTVSQFADGLEDFPDFPVSVSKTVGVFAGTDVHHDQFNSVLAAKAVTLNKSNQPIDHVVSVRIDPAVENNGLADLNVNDSAEATDDLHNPDVSPVGNEPDLSLREDFLRGNNPFAHRGSPSWSKALEENDKSADIDNANVEKNNKFAALDNYEDVANEWESAWEVHNSRRVKKRGLRELRSLQSNWTQPSGSMSRRPARTDYNSS